MLAKINKFAPLLFSLMGLGIGYVIANPSMLGLCQRTYEFGGHIGCLDQSIKAFGDPIVAFMLPVVLFSIILVFANRIVVNAWSKFAWVGVIISIIVIALFPVDDRGWLPMGLTRANAAWVMGGLFTLISLAVIAWKYWRLSGKK